MTAIRMFFLIMGLIFISKAFGAAQHLDQSESLNQKISHSILISIAEPNKISLNEEKLENVLSVPAAFSEPSKNDLVETSGN